MTHTVKSLYTIIFFRKSLTFGNLSAICISSWKNYVLGSSFKASDFSFHRGGSSYVAKMCKPFSFNIRNTAFFHPIRPRAQFTQKGVAIPSTSLSFLSGGFQKKITGKIMFTFLSMAAHLLQKEYFGSGNLFRYAPKYFDIHSQYLSMQHNISVRSKIFRCAT